MEDIIYLVTKVLTAIFKRRPYIAFFVLLFLGIIALGIWLLLAKTPDDRIFPIIALIFVFIVLIWYTALIIRRWDTIKNQTYGEPDRPPAREPESIRPAPATLSQPVYPRTPPVKGKPSVQASHLTFGALASVLMSAPLVTISTFAVIFSPLISEQDAEGYMIVAIFLLCILVPLAAGLGAFFGTLVGRKARKRDPGRLNRLAAVAGGITGLILGIISFAAFFLLANASGSTAVP